MCTPRDPLARIPLDAATLPGRAGSPLVLAGTGGDGLYLPDPAGFLGDEAPADNGGGYSDVRHSGVQDLTLGVANRPYTGARTSAAAPMPGTCVSPPGGTRGRVHVGVALGV